MQIVFLGTGAASPTIRRNVSSLAVRFLKHGYWWMFDCGEGTQHRLLKSTLTLPKLNRIFLTHLDGDHCFGIPGVLLSRALQGGKEPLDLFGFRPLEKWINTTLSATGSRLSYDLFVHAVREGQVMQADEFLDTNTLFILVLGIVAFSIGTASGVLMGKAMNRMSKQAINPLIGAAGVSAVPMAARVANKVGLDANPHNVLLMHAMGPNVAGVIGSAVAAGIMIMFTS